MFLGLNLTCINVQNPRVNEIVALFELNVNSCTQERKSLSWGKYGYFLELYTVLLYLKQSESMIYVLRYALIVTALQFLKVRSDKNRFIFVS